jgi:hypothetical protein
MSLPTRRQLWLRIPEEYVHELRTLAIELIHDGRKKTQERTNVLICIERQTRSARVQD